MNILLKSIAIVSSFVVGSHAMETEYEETPYFPQEVIRKILRHASTNRILDLSTDVSFKDVYGDLRLVCINWQSAIDNDNKSHKTDDTWNQKKKNYWVEALVSAYETIGYGDDCRLFLNGKLQYTPNQGDPTILWIMDKEKPFAGEFNLSKCGDAGNYLSISTGYRKGKKPENANKEEIWFCPWFVINQDLERTASHFEPIFESWDKTVAPMGIFWTPGNWHEMSWFVHLTSKNVTFINNNNLPKLRECCSYYGIHPFSDRSPGWRTPLHVCNYSIYIKNFMFVLNQN